MISVVLIDDAEAQLAEILAWWEQHRDVGARFVLDELERCLRLLGSAPDAGTRFLRSRVPHVRRVPMRRSKHDIYYLHDESRAVVYVLAIWSASRSAPPLLRDPR